MRCSFSVGELGWRIVGGKRVMRILRWNEMRTRVYFSHDWNGLRANIEFLERIERTRGNQTCLLILCPMHGRAYNGRFDVLYDNAGRRRPDKKRSVEQIGNGLDWIGSLVILHLIAPQNHNIPLNKSCRFVYAQVTAVQLQNVELHLFKWIIIWPLVNAKTDGLLRPAKSYYGHGYEDCPAPVQ